MPVSTKTMPALMLMLTKGNRAAQNRAKVRDLEGQSRACAPFEGYVYSGRSLGRPWGTSFPLERVVQ